ncbi:MAG TPA: nucleotide exchange factor GrpE [Candidatus Limnocylindrales bacterium]|nr:nucleotide exchange factor GrpE [Candidatus Limnocylindrales bacterium]
MTTKKNTNTDEVIEEQGELNEVEIDDELEQLKRQLESADDSHKRALADYQNLQKRVSDERRELILAANRDLLLRILSILDTLVLANKHDASEGLKISISKFLDVLKSEGVIKIETVGKEFSPLTMEAIAVGEGKDGEVIEEIQSGYLLNEKLLRAAQVKVGSGKQDQEGKN